MHGLEIKNQKLRHKLRFDGGGGQKYDLKSKTCKVRNIFQSQIVCQIRIQRRRRNWIFSLPGNVHFIQFFALFFHRIDRKRHQKNPQPLWIDAQSNFQPEKKFLDWSDSPCRTKRRAFLLKEFNCDATCLSLAVAQGRLLERHNVWESCQGSRDESIETHEEGGGRRKQINQKLRNFQKKQRN